MFVLDKKAVRLQIKTIGVVMMYEQKICVLFYWYSDVGDFVLNNHFVIFMGTMNKPLARNKLLN